MECEVGSVCGSVLVVRSELLSVSVVCGLVLGLLSAVLTHLYCTKPLLLRSKIKGPDPWSLMEMERDEDTEISSVERKPEPAETEKQFGAVNSDVSVFALKAKVVYPINQRFRPLADGASNPSLCESPKAAGPPEEESSCSSDDNCQSREREEDEEEEDDASQYLSTGPSSNIMPSPIIRKVQYYPHTLCYPGIEGRVSLLCLTLQNLNLHTAQLQQEKWSVILQILRALLSKENCLLLLQKQEKELEQLMSSMTSNLLRWEKGAEPALLICSIEEVERAGREKLQHTLQMALSLAKQLDELCECCRSSAVDEGALRRSLLQYTLLLEEQTGQVQTVVMKMLYERLQWWKELSGWLNIRMTLLRREALLRVSLTVQSLQQLRTDGDLEVLHVEKLMSDLQTAVNEALQNFSDEIGQQTMEMVCQHYRKPRVKMRMMMKSQAREKRSMLELHKHDALQLVTLIQELQVKHWTQRRDFELKQDRRVSDVVCQLWKRLFSSFSRRVKELWEECVLDMLNTHSAFSALECQTLINNVELRLSSQIQQEENHTHQHLHTLTQQLEQEAQMWIEEEVLAEAGFKHLEVQQMKVVKAVTACQKEKAALIEEQHRLLVMEMKRILAARHFYIQTVKEMKLTQLRLQPDIQALQQEQLSEVESVCELLREHVQFLSGRCLTSRAALRSTASTDTSDHTHKERLKNTVCESGYVTPECVSSLIVNYYSRIRPAVTWMSDVQQQHIKIKERQCKREVCVKTLQRELSNWARKPQSVEFYKRVENQKRCYLSLCEKGVYKDQAEMLNLQHQILTIKDKLWEEERSFLFQLAALARSPLTELNKQPCSL